MPQFILLWECKPLDVGFPFLSVHAHLAKAAPDLLLLDRYHQYELSRALYVQRLSCSILFREAVLSYILLNSSSVHYILLLTYEYSMFTKNPIN